MSDISEWFQCVRCDDGNVSVKQVLGLGNFSVNVECSCGYRYVERDANSDNWNTEITVKQHITGQRLRAPKASLKGHNLVHCPTCGSSEVEFWVYSDNAGIGNGETVGRVRLNCKDCSRVEENEVRHS